MVASLVRLLHSGPQDERLLPKDGPRDVSAQVRVLTRAGRMTTQWHRLDFQQKPQFGQQAFCNLVTKGELLTRLYLVVNLPDIQSPQATALAAAGPGGSIAPRFGWVNSLGHTLIQNLTLDIGGARVETIDSRLLEIMDEQNTPLEKLVNTNAMIGRLDNGFTETSFGNSVTPTQVVVPLPFWFSRGDMGAALPIDAIHVDQVRVGIQFRPVTGCYQTDSRAPTAAVVPTTEGSALWPILGSSFYSTAPGGTEIIPGLALNRQAINTPVSTIPGIKMPQTLSLGDCYLLAEQVYLDKPEANRFRLADIQIPVAQHQRVEPRDNRGFADIQIPLEINNPVRQLFFMAQNQNAIPYNTFFLATKDLASPVITSGPTDSQVPWWPDCSGLNAQYASQLIPGFSQRGDQEPFRFLELTQENNQVRTSTDNCALYRTILPSLEERKSPFINRQMYCLPFGTQAGFYPPSTPLGEANFNRIMKKNLRFGIGSNSQGVTERVWVYVYAETQNILRIFGGRAGLLFAY